MKKIKMGSGGKMRTVPISELLEQRIEFQTITNNTPLLAFTIAEGVINPEDKKSNKRDFLMKDKDNKRFELTEKDDIIYNPANVVFGAIHRNALGKGVVSPIYKIFKCIDVDPLYMDCVVSRSSFIFELSKYAEGSVTKLRTLAPESFLDLKITVPTDVDEQHKIGVLIENLKTKIENEKKQIEKLKTLKASMLDEMFPQKGETEPEIRFPGFTDAWEQRKLIDLLDQPITDGPHETPNIVDDGIPFISADAIVDNKIDFTRKRGNITEEYDLQCCKKYKPEFHDVYLVKSGSTVGKVAIVETTQRFNIWSPLAAMRCKENSDPYFLFALLQTKENQAQVKDKASTGTQPNLSMRALEQFDIVSPYSRNEQIKIGEFFNNLDNLITLHQRKYEKLIDTKKAFLEKMIGGEE